MTGWASEPHEHQWEDVPGSKTGMQQCKICATYKLKSQIVTKFQLVEVNRG